MNRNISFVVAIAMATVFSSTDMANAQLLDTISRAIPQRLTRPFQISQPQQRPSCSRPPIQTQPPRYTQPIYNQPVYSRPVYRQPIYTQPVTVNPIIISPTPAPARSAADIAKDRAKQLGSEAKQQFRNGQYTEAKKTLDQLVKLVPNDASGWQFRSIVSFTTGDFEGAAADIYDAMRLGNTWTRKSINNLYGANSSDYDQQLAKLTEAVTKTPSMQGHFLLAYHHIVNEQFKDGRNELQNVLKLEPEEPLSKKLLIVLNQRLAQK